MEVRPGLSRQVEAAHKEGAETNEAEVTPKSCRAFCVCISVCTGVCTTVFQSLYRAEFWTHPISVEVRPGHSRPIEAAHKEHAEANEAEVTPKSFRVFNVCARPYKWVCRGV